MLTKILFFSAFIWGLNSSYAQNTVSIINLNSCINNSPIYMEASLNSPVLHSIANSNTKMQYLDFAFDKSNQKNTNKESVFANNLFIKVQVFSSNKAKDNVHGMEEIKGYIPVYYLLDDSELQSLMKMIYPNKLQEPNSLPKKEEKNKKKKK